MSEQPLVEQKAQHLATVDFRAELRLIDPELIRVLKERERATRILMEYRHGIILGGEDYKAYHGEDPEVSDDENTAGATGAGHINRVAERNVIIMKTFFEAEGEPKTTEEAGDREEQLLFAHYLGQIHDLVLNYKIVQIVNKGGKDVEEDIKGDWKQYIGPGKRIKRIRAVGKNENDTSDDEIKFMDEINEQRGKQGKKELFNDKHKEWVRRALLVTIPAWNGATVFQPELRVDDSRLTYATAWADLKGGIFMDGWEQFFKEGDLNLLEDNLDIIEVVLYPEKYPRMIEEVGERIREWRRNQIVFARAQWEQLQVQISRFPQAEGLLRERIFKQAVYDDTFQKISERAKMDQTTPALQLLAPLRELVLAEQRKYSKTA